MDHINLVIATNNADRFGINLGLSNLSKELNVEFDLSFLGDDNIENSPTNAIVYTHGSYIDDNKNLEDMDRLAYMRPDLRVIMKLESSMGRKAFCSDKAYDLYQRLLGEHNEMIKAGFDEFDEVFPIQTEHDNEYQFVKFDPTKFLIFSTVVESMFFARPSFYFHEGKSEPHMDNYLKQWLAQPHLDFVVVYDKGQDSHYDTFGHILLGELSQQLGFRYSFDWKAETAFANPDEFPEGALVYTHTSYNQEHRNLAKVHELAEARPDLRFLIRAEPVQKVSPGLQSFYNEIMTADFSPTSRAVAVGDSPMALTGLRTMDDPSYSVFKEYVQDLIEMRTTK